MTEEDFLKKIEPETKIYTYYLSNGLVVKDIKSDTKPPDTCAYSFYSEKNKTPKYFVLQSRGMLYDPNEIKPHYNRQKVEFKSCNKNAFEAYVLYLDPKKRSRFRLIAAQKAL